MPRGKAGDAVEHRQRVTHPPIGLLGDEPQSRFVRLDPLLLGHVAQVLGDVPDRDTLEVIDLAAREDRGQDLVLLRRGEDEDGVAGGLLERLEEGVEGRRREHVHLVDDVDLVAPEGWRHGYLLGQGTDVVDRIIGRGVELEDVEGALLVEGTAALTRVAGLAVGLQVGTVDRLGEHARRCRLPHPTRAAEEIGVCELALQHRRTQCRGHSPLPHDTVEAIGAILTSRDDILI